MKPYALLETEVISAELATSILLFENAECAILKAEIEVERERERDKEAQIVLYYSNGNNNNNNNN
mgnify:CR=1 FL=1